MTRRRTTAKPSRRELFAYHEALLTIAPHWNSGPHPRSYRMPAAVRQAYQLVGRFAARYHAPRKGTRHPGKSSSHRLKTFLLEYPTLPAGFNLVTRQIHTSDRAWSSTILELHHPAGVVTRYRPGLRHPTLSIRGTSRGRGSAALHPCDWRPISKKEAKTLHPVTNAFLDALQPRWRASYGLPIT